MLCRRTDPHEDLFGGRRCCGRVGDAQFLFHGRRDVRQRSLVEGGIQLHNPNNPSGERWIHNFKWKNTALNFGVGYPF